ncbi:hypothetical protein AB0J83_47935 [Actinoplanes sp. NPDC049596]|uniref:hypothetical protein n=1 Tax=unclassified Actinoplanes TaxID=2626549 RepID=UPI0034221C02
MAHGVVLRPDPDTSDALIALSQAIGGSSEPIMLLGAQAPPHVSVLHWGADDSLAEVMGLAGRYRENTFEVRIIGLLYAVIPAGDYYVPQGGHYFGLEIVRRPGLDALHHAFLELAADPLGQVGPDFRPHITLGVTARPPVLPPLSEVPTGILSTTMAAGPVGPYGTFPQLAAV